MNGCYWLGKGRRRGEGGREGREGGRRKGGGGGRGGGSGAWVLVVSMYVNGVLVLSTGASMPTQYMNLNQIDIGSWSPEQTSLGGSMSSFLIFNTVLTESERQRVEGHLAWKWWNNGSSILNTLHPWYSIQPPTDIGTRFKLMSDSS